jgi:hypothetical protein
MLKGGRATGVLHIARLVIDRGEGLNLEAENQYVAQTRDQTETL